MGASREILNDINASAKDTAQAMGKAWSDRYHNVEARAKEALHNSEDFVREHPVSTVLGACAVGFVAGVLLSRRH